MASDQKFVDFIIEQINIPNQITYKKMFGEYGLYLGNKMFALICDNKLYIKPTQIGKEFINDLIEAPPYPGAKPYFLIEEELENRDWLKKIVNITANVLPEPKPKQKKAKNK